MPGEWESLLGGLGLGAARQLPYSVMARKHRKRQEEQEEAERRRLEALAKLYQFNEAETAELLQTGNVAQVRAEKERRIKQKEAERVQKFQKAEEAGRALTQRHLLKDMPESVRGKLSREAQVGRGEVSVPQMTEFEQKGTLGQVLLPGEEVAKIKQRRLLETEAKKRKLPLDRQVTWNTALQQARLILSTQARDREKQVQEIRTNMLMTESRLPKPDELPPPVDFSDANIRKVAKEIQQQGELPTGLPGTKTPKARPEDAFIAEHNKLGKDIELIDWDAMRTKYPTWDIEYIKQQLGM